MFFSRDSQKLMVKSSNDFKVYSSEDGEEIGEYSDLGTGQTQVGFSPNRTKMALLKLSGDKEVVVVDLENLEELHSNELEGDFVSVSVDNTGDKVALGKQSCQFEIWDMNEIDD